ncbi:MAG: peptide-methionine (S)-S-oxide reductase MsrA [Gemmatimonadota bacterium]|jgi:peptide-methionine (S)-S-oxide reductase
MTDGHGGRETTTLGGGCFWCLEAVFEEVRGVRSVKSGYAGGHVEHPTYRQVCGKGTGHAEVVQVEFDPDEISFRELLKIFFTIHDPTTRDRQGADVGPQYRSIVLFHSADQERITREVMRELEEAGIWEGEVVTEVQPFERFWPAEVEHDEYYRRNPNQPYCRIVIDPKVAKFRATFPGKRRAPSS